MARRHTADGQRNAKHGGNRRRWLAAILLGTLGGAGYWQGGAIGEWVERQLDEPATPHAAPDSPPDTEPPHAGGEEPTDPTSSTGEIVGRTFSGTFRPEPGKTYRDCTFDGKGAQYAIDARNGSGALFVGSRITNAEKGIIGRDFTLRDCQLWEFGSDAINVEGGRVLVDGCTISRLGLRPYSSERDKPHGDGLQLFNGSGVVVRDTLFDLTDSPRATANACILVKSFKGRIGKVTIGPGNEFRGGGHNLQVRKGDSGMPSSIVVEGNAFREFVYASSDASDGFRLDRTMNDMSQAIRAQ